MEFDLDVYPFEMRPLTSEEGGGFLVTYPDFVGFIGSDGETIEEALANGRQALQEALEAMKVWGDPIPEPGMGPASGKFIARVPKRIHAELTRRAKTEGVSMNTLVVAFVAEGLGRGQQNGRQA